MTSDPVRLLEDPSAGSVLRTDLVHAAEAELHGFDLAGGLAALQKATATVTSSTTVVAGTSLLAKLGIGAAGVAVGAVALWLGLGGGDAGPGAGDGERVSPPAVVSAAERELEAPRAPAEAAADRTAGTATPVRAEPVPSEPTKIEPEPEPEVGEPAVGEPAVGEPEAAKPAVRRKGATGDRPSASSEKTGADPAVDSVLREAKLVAKARSNLARDPSRALALADEAERDFPEGQLVEERRAIAIRALVALGRLDEAQRRAEPFLAEYGRGAHAAAVRRALEGQTGAP
jgi:hypothetical protein